VSLRKQKVIIVTEFEKRLKISLEECVRLLPRLNEDDRLMPILSHLGSNFIGPVPVGTYTSTEGVTAESIDIISICIL
jgi:DNA primase large subunit